MQKPRIPDGEDQRLQELSDLRILDTAPEAALDELVRLAATIMRVPIALVSLVDNQRQWFKARYGLEARETPRDISFCGHVVGDAAPLVVEDATSDVRFNDNPLVTGDPFVRFYAGYPLTTSRGNILGTLCVLDRVQHHPEPGEIAALKSLAALVVMHIERQHMSNVILDAASDAIFLTDSVGTIISCNAAASRLFGWSPGELRGSNVKILMPAQTAERHDDHMRKYQATSQSRILGVTRALHAQRQDLSLFPIELTVNHVDIEGERMFTGLIRDVTERHRVERLKEEFISNVSHELRTPLTAIRGSLGLIESGALDQVGPESMAQVRTSLQNCLTLEKLIDDLLDIEKVKTGRLEIHLQNTDLQRLVIDVAESNRGFADLYGVKLKVEASARLEITTDPGRLSQVLTNLISNACKFSPKGAEIEIAMVAADGKVRLSVSDRGPGIPESFRPRMFSRFEQADSGSTRRERGSGLGLSIARSILDLLGGEISYAPRDGGGSRFQVLLPLAAPAGPLIASGGPAPDSTGTTDAAELLDRERLQKLFVNVGNDGAFIQELLDSAAARLPGVVAAIETATEHGDHITIVKRAHEIVGLAGTLGLTRVAGLAGAIEEAATKGQFNRRQVEELAKAVALTIVAIAPGRIGF